MSWLGLTPDRIAERARSSAAPTPPPTLRQSLVQATLGFGLTGGVAVGAVGCGRPWMFRLFGEVGPYLVGAALFVVLGGAALGRLVIGPGRMPRFYALFTAAFFAYAAVWTVAYFALGGVLGELAGGLAGAPAAAAWVADVAWRWRRPESHRGLPRALVAGWRLFFLFMVFNGAVVFGTTPARWLGSVVCLALVALWWLPIGGGAR